MTDHDDNGGEVLTLSVLNNTPGLLEVFTRALNTVPDGSGDDATIRIVASIMQAQGIDDLNRPWNAEGLRDYLDRPLIVHAAKRMPSSYDQGLGWFLVLDVEDARGKRLVVTTGSVSIVAQLVQAHALGMFPVGIIPRQAATPSKAGYYPMHVEVFHAGVEAPKSRKVAAGA